VSSHIALDRLPTVGPSSGISTAGRLRKSPVTDDVGGWRLTDAAVDIPLDLASVDGEPADGQLVRIEGDWTGERLEARILRVVHRPSADSTFVRPGDAPGLGDALAARAELRARTRRYFDDRDFLEVETPHAVRSPGTDLYLDPVGMGSLDRERQSDVPGYLHTSPEFAMKRLLSEGVERLYQICRVWRDGEFTDRHHPEFTMLEWYRAWEDLDAVITDTERVVTRATGGTATVVERTPEGRERREIAFEPPFDRVTMRELVDEACGFDILSALDYASLRRKIVRRDLLDRGIDRRHPPPDAGDEGRWDELFFELMVSELEPHLATMGAVVVTEWPARLAILARKSDEDPRVARRFELFVGGLELANGFDELTDPDEQRARFERDLRDRRDLDKPELPMPEDLLQALEYGLPPSAGVALGLDRLAMLDLGTPRIGDVSVFRPNVFC